MVSKGLLLLREPTRTGNGAESAGEFSMAQAGLLVKALGLKSCDPEFNSMQATMGHCCENVIPTSILAPSTPTSPRLGSFRLSWDCVPRDSRLPQGYHVTPEESLL